MPCYDERNSPNFIANEARDAARKEFRHNSDVAEMLCHLMRQIEAASENPDLELNVPSSIWLWWQQHKIRDAEKGKA